MEHQAGLAAAVDAAQLGIFEEDLSTGTVTWHGHHESIWGYRSGEFDGSYAMFAQRVHPGDLPRVKLLQAQARTAGEPFSFEYRLCWPNGSERWVTEHGRFVTSESGEPLRLVGVVMDITQRKLGELRLQQLTQRADGILEHMTDGFVMLDRELRYTYVNRHALALCGRTADDLLGRSFYDTYPEAHDTLFDQALQRALTLGTPQHTEAFYPPWQLWIDGHMYPSEEGVSVFFRDITPRKLAEENSAEMMRRLQALRKMDAALLAARSMADVGAAGTLHTRSLLGCRACVLVLLDATADRLDLLAAEGELPLRLQPGASCTLRAVGVDAVDALRYEGVFQLTHLSSGPRKSWLWRELRRSGITSLTAVALSVDGVLAGALVTLCDDIDPLGEDPLGVVRGVADRLSITMQQVSLRERIERHTHELERRVAERTAQMNAANRELEAFSYSVSHDLRAPLAAMAAFTERLRTLRGDEAGEQERHCLDRIGDSASHLATLIQAMLDLAHVGRAAMRAERVDLSALAHASIERLRERDAGRDVQVHIEPGLQATGDPVLLAAVLANLLDNAWKFTSKTAGACIALRATHDEAGQTTYHVSDNGAGFDMGYADKLFQTFRRLHSDQDYPGTGIGLATVQRIVARHGGRVWATSQPGVTTVVSFTLDMPPAG